jgi:hypothetical protein
METRLPAPEDYYRLTRARELRRHAIRLRTWAGVLLIPLLFAGAAVLLPLAVLMFGAHRNPAVGVSGLGCALGIPGLVLVYVRSWLLEAATSRVRSAELLEEEHQGRYGPETECGG